MGTKIVGSRPINAAFPIKFRRCFNLDFSVHPLCPLCLCGYLAPREEFKLGQY